MKSFLLKHKLTFSVIVTAVQFLLVFSAISFFFHSDEYHAEISLSGDYFGAYSARYPFINGLFARFLIDLYRICGAIPWYSLFDLFFLFCAFTAIHYSLITVMSAKRVSLPLIEGVYSVVFCIALLPNLSAISFTPVAGLLSIAGISLLFTKLCENGKNRAPRVISVIFMLFSFLLRMQSCLVGICFYLLVLLVVDMVSNKASKKGIKAVLKGLIPSFVIVVVLVSSLSVLAISNGVLRNTSDGQAVLRWNDARSKYFDYYDVENYKKDSDFFDSIGYSESLFKLTTGGWFLDEKCDYKHLAKISDYMDDSSSQKGMKSTVSNLMDGIVENINNRKMVPLLIGCFVLGIGGIALIISNKSKNKYWWLFYIIATVAGTVILCLYLSFVGRFRYHVFRLCVSPAFFCLLFGCIALMPCREQKEVKTHNAVFNIMTISAVLLPLLILIIAKAFVEFTLVYYLCIVLFTVVLLLYFCLDYGVSLKKPFKLIIPSVMALLLSMASNMSVYQTASNTRDYEKEQPVYQTVAEYLKTHNDGIYVSTFWNKTDIKNFVTDSYSMRNCFFSFDYMQFSDVYKNKLLLNGKNTVTITSLLQDDVLFIGNDSKENEKMRNLLTDYISEQCGKPVIAKVKEKLDNGVKVYKFVCASENRVINYP